MKSLVYLGNVFTFFLYFACGFAVPHGNETDKIALLNFKAKIVDDPFMAFSSWNESIDFCQWKGVTCGHKHKGVTMLDLRHYKLRGSISPYLGNLSFLRTLSLFNNSLVSEIPPELGRLKRLENLWLFNNSITGVIPSNLSQCSKLVTFDISYNEIVGTIPYEFGDLLKLQAVYMRQNRLTGGIPHSLGNLSSLVELILSNNLLNESIPYTLGKLRRLKVFVLDNNKFSGTIPPQLFNISSIHVFHVAYNRLGGSLPSFIGNTMPNLELIRLSGNNFTGSLPVSMSNLSNMVNLLAVNANLTGKVPDLGKLRRLSVFSVGHNLLGSGAYNDDDLSFISSLTNASSLNIVSISNNNFGGVLPNSISNVSTTLSKFFLSENKISGSIPNGMDNLFNLDLLDISDNQFTGTIFPSIGNLQKLQLLDLSTNKFSGSIPSSLGNLTRLTKVYLDENNLQGNIPSTLGNLSLLLALSLSENSLTGKIPPQVFGLSSLSLVLNLSHNKLTDLLPTEVGNLKNLDALDISNNLLSGNIPGSLGSCMSLEILYMDSNSFQGNIPAALRLLRGIQYMDFSQNNLSGQIPEFLGGFDLHYLNISFNDFEGSLPTKGIFNDTRVVSVEGNIKLCGGVIALHLPTCNFKIAKKKKSTSFLKIVLLAVFGFVGLTLAMCCLYFCVRGKNSKASLTNAEEDYSLLRISYQHLLKATDGFSAANLIGVGSFGSVYKGILESGRIIAVKVLNLEHHGASKSFAIECEALRNIRHRNLVKVLTSCSGVDYQGNDFKAIVLDFMVNGSLDKWLHPMSNEDKFLGLVLRLNLAIDIASAIDYLQNHCPTTIVHCDIKPSNILLDEEMVGHVGDFGLARIFFADSNKSSSQQTSSIGVKGSIGYTPPEYGMGSEVSTAGDIYSYGVLLLEMFTGKSPTDEMFSGDKTLQNYVKMCYHDRVFEISDQTLLQNKGDHASISKIEECLIAVYEVAIACAAESPRDRMKIVDVLAHLRRIKNNIMVSK